MRTDSLPEGFADRQGIDLTGFTVVNEDGSSIGSVLRIEENPAHALLVVKRADADSSSKEGEDEVLIPLVDEFLVAIEEEAGEILVSLPDGLLDL